MRRPLLASLLVPAALLLGGCQGRLIYYPQRYPSDVRARVPPGTQALTFATSEGRQVAWYRPPAAGGAPSRVWACFSGNGGVALDWLGFAMRHPEPDVGFLFVDYPGYGECEGSPTPGRIRDSSEAAVGALAAHLGMAPDALEQRMAVLGHSLGAASALQYAARHPVQRVVLVSPFTSLVDMARRLVGWPLCHAVWHRFDNRARLAELAARREPVPVTIIHGSADDVVPVAMGRELAALHPGRVTLREIPGADHNWILQTAEAEIVAAMVGERAAQPERHLP